MAHTYDTQGVTLGDEEARRPKLRKLFFLISEVVTILIMPASLLELYLADDLIQNCFRQY